MRKKETHNVNGKEQTVKNADINVFQIRNKIISLKNDLKLIAAEEGFKTLSAIGFNVLSNYVKNYPGIEKLRAYDKQGLT